MAVFKNIVQKPSKKTIYRALANVCGLPLLHIEANGKTLSAEPITFEHNGIEYIGAPFTLKISLGARNVATKKSDYLSLNQNKVEIIPVATLNEYAVFKPIEETEACEFVHVKAWDVENPDSIEFAYRCAIGKVVEEVMPNLRKCGVFIDYPALFGQSKYTNFEYASREDSVASVNQALKSAPTLTTQFHAGQLLGSEVLRLYLSKTAIDAQAFANTSAQKTGEALRAMAEAEQALLEEAKTKTSKAKTKTKTN